VRPEEPGPRPASGPATAAALREHPSIRTEQVLSRSLKARQQAMLAIGGAIGTGLFLGTGLAVQTAGPAILLAYVLMAALAMLQGAALTEMCVAHPTAGSFGVYAQVYLSPFAGYAVRASYWLMEVVATGGHMVATAVYMRYWFPEAPGALWIVGFSALIVLLNTRTVSWFGEFEYWFVAVKVAAVAAFIVLGAGVILGATGEGAVGLRDLFLTGGLLPQGPSGVWLACAFVLYAYIGVEVVAVASGEAHDPERSIPRAMRQTVLGLTALYVAAIAVLVAIIPWREAGVGESPFVTVLRRSGVPGAAGLMNFVVLSAALSGANANFYLVSRTLFSLARAGHVPAAVGGVDGRGTPVNAVLASSLGLGLAVLVEWLWPESAYVWFLGVALFGALFVWTMVFVVHLRFRSVWSRPGAPPLPYRSPFGRPGSVLGAVMLAALFATAWWVPGLRSTVLAAGPWLAVLFVSYRLSARGPSRGD
jgi:L-asparagine transporter-like permease